jgi:hypothetical protein
VSRDSGLELAHAVSRVLHALIPSKAKDAKAAARAAAAGAGAGRAGSVAGKRTLWDHLDTWDAGDDAPPAPAPPTEAAAAAAEGGRPRVLAVLGDPEALVARTGAGTGSVLLWLGENAPGFFGAVEDYAAAADALSVADLLVAASWVRARCGSVAAGVLTGGARAGARGQRRHGVCGGAGLHGRHGAQCAAEPRPLCRHASAAAAHGPGCRAGAAGRRRRHPGPRRRHARPRCVRFRLLPRCG